jgi:hypothetical protein
VRAFGSNRTHAPLIRAGAGASMMGSCHTVPVNESAPMRREGVAPSGLMSMSALSSCCVAALLAWIEGSPKRAAGCAGAAGDRVELLGALRGQTADTAESRYRAPVSRA